MTDDAAPPPDLIGLTAAVVVAYVANNNLSADAVPSLIASAHAAFTALDAPSAVAKVEDPSIPAVSVRKSLADPNRLISMIDGKPYSSLKRHLTTHGLTPTEYRYRYRLPADYPMVAPGYSARRSALAKSAGLGRKPNTAAPVAPEPKARGGRKPRATKAS